MYLSKQWRESRIISGIAVLALLLLLLLVVKGAITVNSIHAHRNDNADGFAMVFIPLFYIEAGLVAFWGWLVAGIGAGKNLGEDSGSFLFTRPRRRAWFLWNDWGFAMAQIAAIILIGNIMVGLLLKRVLVLMHSPGYIQMGSQSTPVSLVFMMLLISVGVLLFAGLIYGVTYFSTVIMKRAAGVMLGAGILVGYVILRALIHHYFPSIHLPNLILGLFSFDNHSVNGLSGNLGLSIAARAVAMLLFPLAAQVILDKSEI
jgi:hypothetical protein